MVEFLSSPNATALANFLAIATGVVVVSRVSWGWTRSKIAELGPYFRRNQQRYIFRQLMLLKDYRNNHLLLVYDMTVSALIHLMMVFILSYVAGRSYISGYFHGAHEVSVESGMPDFYREFIRMPDVWLDAAHSVIQAVGLICIFMAVSFYFTFRRVRAVAMYEDSRRKLLDQYLHLRSER